MAFAGISALPILTLNAAASPALTISWENNFLTIRGEHLPGKEMKVQYLEAYCRPNSQTTDWVKHTVVGHKTALISASPDHRQIKLHCTLTDGVIVDHTITARADEVDFRIVARNPRATRSEAHWAQPCIRVGEFTGTAGCFSADDKMIFATAFEPYQELFQGVATCLHSDFRLGGLQPGETKKVRGKIYFVPNDVPKLLKRYAKDFPEQVRKK
ncbi:MAG: hypothetical protein HY043_09795 [Verrucomicrobia bacterium]|nr:hypothetical protein [Verrucomicrobiota bacterium]